MYSPTPISCEQAIHYYPTLAAVNPHYSRSAKYQQVSTIDVLKKLERNGFAIHHINTARVRDSSKIGYEKHLIRLRHVDAESFAGIVPEIIAINSHDGSCSWQLMAGMFRFACANGLIVGEKWSHVSVKHKGSDVADKVIEGTYTVLKEVDKIRDRIDRFRSIIMDMEQQERFAKDAFALRFGPEKDKAPVSPLAMLFARREDDKGSDLWSVYNRVQENLIKGGFRGRIVGANGFTRRSTMRPIRGIDGDVNLNRRLFDLAESYAEKLAA